MRTPQDLHNYQRKAIIGQLFHPDSVLSMRPGKGKTVITLTTINQRMTMGQVKKTLIFGPVRVIHSTWKREALKWTHLQHLRFTVVHGDPQTRAKRLHSDGSDIYLINYENLNWLAEELKRVYLDNGLPIPFQMVVYDELTRVKNSTSVRVAGRKQDAPVKMTKKAGAFTLDDFLAAGWQFDQLLEHGYCKIGKAGKKVGWRPFIDQFSFRTGMTGSLSSNGYIDLHGQYLVIDGGRRLGEFKTHFKDAYFQSDYMGWSCQVTDLGKRAIEQRIADITLVIDSEDNSQMPELDVHDIWVDLPQGKRRQYDEIEKEFFTRLDCGTEIEIFSKTSVGNKCLQFANGACFIEPGKPEWAHAHDEKLEALDSLIEEACGAPVLLGYSFRHDVERIMARYKHLRPVNMSDVRGTMVDKTIEKWQRGDIRLLLGHPASMGHGIDGLQGVGGMLIWFGCPWSYELYDQMICRLHRQGGGEKVDVYRILAADTMDLAVIEALRMKQTTDVELKRAIMRYRQGLILPEAA